MLTVSRSLDLWICANQILVVYNRGGWPDESSGLTQAKSWRRVGKKECTPEGLKEHWHLSTEEIEWDVSEQQRLDRPGVVEQAEAPDVMVSWLQWDQTYRRQRRRTSVHTHKYTDTLRSLQRPLGLKKRCGAWLFAQGLHCMGWEKMTLERCYFHISHIFISACRR